jgi:hypothetical protein
MSMAKFCANTTREHWSSVKYIVCFTAVSWKSNKQICVALSMAEAEYVALASAAQEEIWMRQHTTDLKNGATVIFEDNQSAVSMAKTHSTMEGA